MLWPKLPLLKLFISLILGIYLADLFQDSHRILFFSLLLLVIAFCLLIIKILRRSIITSLSFHLTFLMLGFLLYTYHSHLDKGLKPLGTEDGFLAEVNTVLSPTSFYNRYLVDLRCLRNKDGWQQAEALVLLKTPRSEEKSYLPNDLIQIHGKISKLPKAVNPNQFDYAEYLKYQHVCYQIRSQATEKLKTQSSIAKAAFGLRSKLIEAFENSAISERNLSIFTAILLGDKSELDGQLRNDFSRAGAMHVLAVSGLHLGIVFLLFDQLLRWLRFRRQSWIRVLLLTSIIWGFALLTGMSNSVMRSALMFSFLIASDLLNRKGVGLNSVAASALILLLIDPFRLFQVGFQLSYAAVFGILTIYPPLSKLLSSKYKLINKLLDLMLISFAAQLSTLPFTLAYFHQFPNLFLISNILIVPLAFLIVGGGVLLSLVYLVSGTMWPLDHLLDLLLDLLSGIAGYISQFDWAASSGIWLHRSSLFLLAFAVLLFIAWLHLRRGKYFLKIAILILSVLMIENLELIFQSFQNQFTIYSMRPPKLISIKKGLSASLIRMDSSSEYESKIVEDHLDALGVQSLDTIELALDTADNHFPMLKLEGDSFLIMDEDWGEDSIPFGGQIIRKSVSWQSFQLSPKNRFITYTYADSLEGHRVHNLRDSIFEIKSDYFLQSKR